MATRDIADDSRVALVSYNLIIIVATIVKFCSSYLEMSESVMHISVHKGYSILIYVKRSHVYHMVNARIAWTITEHAMRKLHASG